jgi:membrane protein involved in colicin uptake
VLVLTGTIGDIRIARKGASKSTLPGARWLTIVLAFVLLEVTLFYGLSRFGTDKFHFGWMIVNVLALLLGPVLWNEHRKLRREDAILRKRQAEKEHEAERRQHEERQREAQRQQEAERQREAEQRREAERRRRKAEQEREADRQRQREREQATAQSKMEWWRVLEVAPSASKEEIVRSYRRKIQQCHPDRVAGLAPEFLQLGEEHTKALNAAYAQAMGAQR